MEVGRALHRRGQALTLDRDTSPSPVDRMAVLGSLSFEQFFIKCSVLL